MRDPSGRGLVNRIVPVPGVAAGSVGGDESGSDDTVSPGSSIGPLTVLGTAFVFPTAFRVGNKALNLDHEPAGSLPLSSSTAATPTSVATAAPISHPACEPSRRAERCRSRVSCGAESAQSASGGDGREYSIGGDKKGTGEIRDP